MFGFDLPSSWLFGGAAIAGGAGVVLWLLRSAWSAVAIAAAALMVAAAIFSFGEETATARCDAAAQKLRADQAEASLAEARRLLAANEKILLNDAKRAAAAEAKLRKNQEAVNDTPANSAACLPRDAAKRVFDVR